MTASAIYRSTVKHRRFQPMGHQLSYKVWSLLVDLDEIDGLAGRIPFLSRNRWNIVSFHDRDHGPRDGSDLKGWFTSQTAAVGVDLTGGTVRIMAFPRLLGYTFNPITVWFGYDRDQHLRAVMYEVHNTFGHQHSHLVVLPEASHGTGTMRHDLRKELHVSPFFDQIGTYRVTVNQPTTDYSLTIEYLDEDGGRLLTASQRGKRTELTGRSLLKQFITSPMLTVKVIVGIHWEAIKLLRKGARYRPVPAPPIDDIHVTRLARSTDSAAA